MARRGLATAALLIVALLASLLSYQGEAKKPRGHGETADMNKVMRTINRNRKEALRMARNGGAATNGNGALYGKGPRGSGAAEADGAASSAKIRRNFGGRRGGAGARARQAFLSAAQDRKAGVGTGSSSSSNNNNKLPEFLDPLSYKKRSGGPPKGGTPFSGGGAMGSVLSGRRHLTTEAAGDVPPTLDALLASLGLNRTEMDSRAGVALSLVNGVVGDLVRQVERGETSWPAVKQEVTELAADLLGSLVALLAPNAWAWAMFDGLGIEKGAALTGADLLELVSIVLDDAAATWDGLLRSVAFAVGDLATVAVRNRSLAALEERWPHAKAFLSGPLNTYLSTAADDDDDGSRPGRLAHGAALLAAVANYEAAATGILSDGGSDVAGRRVGDALALAVRLLEDALVPAAANATWGDGSSSSFSWDFDGGLQGVLDSLPPDFLPNLLSTSVGKALLNTFVTSGVDLASVGSLLGNVTELGEAATRAWHAGSAAVDALLAHLTASAAAGSDDGWAQLMTDLAAVTAAVEAEWAANEYSAGLLPLPTVAPGPQAYAALGDEVGLMLRAASLMKAIDRYGDAQRAELVAQEAAELMAALGDAWEASAFGAVEAAVKAAAGDDVAYGKAQADLATLAAAAGSFAEGVVGALRGGALSGAALAAGVEQLATEWRTLGVDGSSPATDVLLDAVAASGEVAALRRMLAASNGKTAVDTLGFGVQLAKAAADVFAFANKLIDDPTYQFERAVSHHRRLTSSGDPITSTTRGIAAYEDMRTLPQRLVRTVTGNAALGPLAAGNLAADDVAAAVALDEPELAFLWKLRQLAGGELAAALELGLLDLSNVEAQAAAMATRLAPALMASGPLGQLVDALTRLAADPSDLLAALVNVDSALNPPYDAFVVAFSSRSLRARLDDFLANHAALVKRGMSGAQMWAAMYGGADAVFDAVSRTPVLGGVALASAYQTASYAPPPSPWRSEWQATLLGVPLLQFNLALFEKALADVLATLANGNGTVVTVEAVSPTTVSLDGDGASRRRHRRQLLSAPRLRLLRHSSSSSRSLSQSQPVGLASDTILQAVDVVFTVESFIAPSSLKRAMATGLPAMTTTLRAGGSMPKATIYSAVLAGEANESPPPTSDDLATGGSRSGDNGLGSGAVGGIVGGVVGGVVLFAIVAGTLLYVQKKKKADRDPAADASPPQASNKI